MASCPGSRQKDLDSTPKIPGGTAGFHRCSKPLSQSDSCQLRRVHWASRTQGSKGRPYGCLHGGRTEIQYDRDEQAPRAHHRMSCEHPHLSNKKLDRIAVLHASCARVGAFVRDARGQITRPTNNSAFEAHWR